MEFFPPITLFDNKRGWEQETCNYSATLVSTHGTSANADGAARRRMKRTIGKGASARLVARHETRGTIGKGANARSAEGRETKNMLGRTASAVSAGRKTLFNCSWP